MARRSNDPRSSLFLSCGRARITPKDNEGPRPCPKPRFPPARFPPDRPRLAPYVECLGAELAVRFLLAYGGAEIYLASGPKGRSPAEALVGAEAVARMADHCQLGQRARPAGAAMAGPVAALARPFHRESRPHHPRL